MKKIKLSIIVVTATILLSGCGTTGSTLLGNTGTTQSASTETSTSSSLLGNILNTVLGSSATLSQSDILGTWKYQSADCVFKSENLLLKAGGEIAATKMETTLNENLAKVGIGVNTCSFTFNSDNTYTATMGGRTISGNYTLDSNKKQITMTYLAGFATMTPYITKSGSKLSLLYEADKLITMLNTIATLSGNNNLKALSSLVSSYDGMMVGMEMRK